MPTAPPFGLINGTYEAGVNVPWNAYGADFGTGGWGYLADWTAVESEMASLHNSGANLARWWVFADGRYSPVFNADGTVNGLNSGFLADIDHMMQIASQNNVKLLFTLVDFLMFNFPQDGGSGVTLGGHANIINDPAVRQSFLDNALKPLLEHIAASPYKDAVLGYDIINEPEAQIAGGYNGSDFFRGEAQLALSDVQSFVAEVTNYIHTYSGGGLATVGSAMPQWTPLWMDLGLDFYQAHYYKWMDWNGPGTGLMDVTSITSDTGRHLDKPVILGEFETNDVSYGFDDTAIYSAEWYLDTIRDKGYAGALGWSITAEDTASNWAAFQPEFANWVATEMPGGTPPPNTVDIVAFADDTGTLGDFTTSDHTISVTGRAAAGAQVGLSHDGVQDGSVLANSSGNWAFAFPTLPDGQHTFLATVGTASDSLTLTIQPDAPPPPPGNLVNGGFENNLTGWTLSGNSGGGQIFVDLGSPHSGAKDAAFGSFNQLDGVLSQDVAAAFGQHYTLSFWSFPSSGGSSPENHFAVEWNGQILFNQTNSPNATYQQHTFDVVGDADGTSKLAFLGYNGPDAWHLDDVSLIPTGPPPPPSAGTVSIGDVSTTEGDSGSHILTFTVTRSGGTATFDVNYATSDGSATSGDYAATSGVLHFAVDQTTQTVAVTINGDTTVEANETFNVNLSNPTNGATLTDSVGVGTITNDDTTPPPPVDQTITGNGSANVLTGGAGNDTIRGLGGNDTINGGPGHDTLTGGSGKDKFIFFAGEANGDVITDFDGNGRKGGDSLEFHNYGAGATFTQVDATHWQIANASHSVVDIIGVSNVHSSDFHFV